MGRGQGMRGGGRGGRMSLSSISCFVNVIVIVHTILQANSGTKRGEGKSSVTSISRSSALQPESESSLAFRPFTALFCTRPQCMLVRPRFILALLSSAHSPSPTATPTLHHLPSPPLRQSPQFPQLLQYNVTLRLRQRRSHQNPQP